MKKKLIAAVLAMCVACMLLLTGCGESTYSIVDKALDKTKSLDSMAAEMKMEMNMEMEGMTMSIPITADLKAKGLNSDSPVTSSAITMSILGQSVEMEMYQEGDWAYIQMDDMKYKTSVTEAESELDYSDDINDMLQNIPENLMEEVELVKGEDGSSTVTISIPDEVFSEIYADFIEVVNESSGQGDGEIAISDAVVKITVADGYVSVYEMEFTMEMTVEEISTKTDVKASVTYKDPGKEVTITPPEGYKDFEELDLSDIA